MPAVSVTFLKKKHKLVGKFKMPHLMSYHVCAQACTHVHCGHTQTCRHFVYKKQSTLDII